MSNLCNLFGFILWFFIGVTMVYFSKETVYMAWFLILGSPFWLIRFYKNRTLDERINKQTKSLNAFFNK